jgi:ParB/RepB/Spo0J family partition protein
MRGRNVSPDGGIVSQPTFQRLQVDLLDSRSNIRGDYGNLEALAGTFEDGGPEEPPVVHPNGIGYIVQAGNRRVEAARQAGITHLWCVVKPPLDDDRELHRRQLIADLHHKSLSPLERAKAMAGLLEETPDLTRVGLARLLGITKSAVTRTLGLLDLAEPVQDALQDELINESIASLLIPLDIEDQKRVLPEILATAGERSDGPTVAAATQIVQAKTTPSEQRPGRPRGTRHKTEKEPGPAQPKKKRPREVDPYDRLLRNGEPTLAVHLLYELSEARGSVVQTWRVCNLDGCSDDLRRQIRVVAGQVRCLAEEIESAAQ